MGTLRRPKHSQQYEHRQARPPRVRRWAWAAGWAPGVLLPLLLLWVVVGAEGRIPAGWGYGALPAMQDYGNSGISGAGSTISSPELVLSPTPDCSGAWQIINSPSPSIDISALNAGVALSPNDAWAVGAYGAGGRVRTLTMRWDANQWNHIS